MIYNSEFGGRMTPEDVTIISETALERYKERLTQRLAPLIHRNFADFMPAFVAKVMESVAAVQKISAATFDNSLYPDGTKFFYRNGASCCVVVEQKPQIRTVTFLANRSEGYELAKPNWRLSFPYVVFLQSYQFVDDRWKRRATLAAYSNKPIRDLKDKVFHPNLPNIGDYEVCFGEFLSKGTIAEQVEQSIAHFWQGVFTKDWGDAYLASPVGNVVEWEKLTKNDPLSVLRIKWNREIPLMQIFGRAGIRCDEIMAAAVSYTQDMVNIAARQARQEVLDECQGVDTESLDKILLDEMAKYLAEKESL